MTGQGAPRAAYSSAVDMGQDGEVRRQPVGGRFTPITPLESRRRDDLERRAAPVKNRKNTGRRVYRGISMHA